MNVEIAGILSGITGLLAYSIYGVSIFRASVKPHRVTFFSLFIINLLLFIAFTQSNSQDAGWLFFGYFIGAFILLFVSIKRGVGGTNIYDKIILTVILLSVILWIVFNSPTVAIYIYMFLVVIGRIPTYKKALRDPESESLPAWLLGSLAAVLSIIALGPTSNWLIATALLPFTYLVNDLATAITIMIGKGKLSK